MIITGKKKTLTMCVCWLISLQVTLANVLHEKYESLSHIYSSYNEDPGLHHYTMYGPWYDKNIQHLREKAVLEGTKVKVLEIGVQSGGSTRVWKRYFRGTLDYVGLDIDPRCEMLQSLEEGIRILIGSQTNKILLSKICETYGPFDLIVDDGGHTNHMILTSLRILWKCMKNNGVYAIEDLHALNMGKYYYNRNTQVSVFHVLAQWMMIRSPALKVAHTHPTTYPNNHPALHLNELSFYDSMVFLHYADNITELLLSDVLMGNHWIKLPIVKPEKKLTLKDWCKNCCIGCYND